MNLTCPVCGYNKINEPKLKWSICPSCGTQFGLSDAGRTWAELRHDWIYNDGATWQDDYVQPPPNWSPISQLRNIDYFCTRADLKNIDAIEPTWLITWPGVVPIGTTSVYIYRTVSAYGDTVILAAPVTNPNGENRFSVNLGFSAGLPICLNF